MPPKQINKIKQGRDTAVQRTNNSSMVSKRSAATQGYFEDAFLQHLVGKGSRRTPLINRGYYVRWRAVDDCLRNFLRVTSGCPRRQILSLGAGFDSLYFRLRAEGALDTVAMFEVDFPDVIQQKASLISCNVTLRSMLDFRLPSLTGPVFLSSDQYNLLGVDIREKDQLEAALGEVGFDWTAPTMILSEVVLTYMETHQSDQVISWAAKNMPQSLFVLYEQIGPRDPFGQIMQDHFRKINSSLHSLQQYPDAAAQRCRFLDQGWDDCVCLDLNAFYLGLVSEEERCRVESLELFDEHEDWHQKCSHYFILTASRGSLMVQALLRHVPLAPSIVPSWSPATVSVTTLPDCVEGLGMASCSVSPGNVLLTGGFSRRGREAAVRILQKGQDAWRLFNPDVSGDMGVRLYHTVTLLPGTGIVVFGGRSSPDKPIQGLCKVTFDPTGPCRIPISDSADMVKLQVEPMVSTGNPPSARWRHTTNVVKHKGKNFLFVYGGKNSSEAVLGDSYFLSQDEQHWTEIPLEGTTPEARHSHSASSYQGGVVVFGGLGQRDVPLGDTLILRPSEKGFVWETIDVHPCVVPRYSHCAHVIGETLVVVGGVWHHSDGVPGGVVINLTTRSSMEFTMDTTSVPWPLMLHSFCSEVIDLEKTEVLLIGGGGNCFSFGTHFNRQPVTVGLRSFLNELSV
ncbi:tRNA wybutosine-synthesizing protein 4 [Nelusetta ayraudi]|uniref:tRNA wybutosine-synthesizing protein 4 n=1 Tax=Nelusetta ayraudi TaxID=303726 RepID=UPI003F72EB9E